MGGRYSRNKGYRFEYSLIQHLKSKGLAAQRIPLSGGASEKGDIKIEIPGTRWGTRTNEAKFIYGEAKCRSNLFRGIYHVYTTATNSKGGGLMLSHDNISVILSYDFADLNLLGERGYYAELTDWSTLVSKISRVDLIKKQIFTKLLNWTNDCDFLVIRIDRMPPLFLRFFR